MDILDMQPIANGSIQVVLDKGTMDALVHGDLYHKVQDSDNKLATTAQAVSNETVSQLSDAQRKAVETQMHATESHSHHPSTSESGLQRETHSIHPHQQIHQAAQPPPQDRQQTQTHTSDTSSLSRSLCGRLVREITRVLCEGGMYVQISDEAPEMRCDFLSDHFSKHWDRQGVVVNFSEIELEGDLARYLYTVKLLDIK